MNFRGLFIEEIDNLGESLIDSDLSNISTLKEIFDAIPNLIEDLAIKNKIVLDKKVMFALVSEFAYYLGKYSDFWDAAENFQPALVRAGIIRYKNYKKTKIGNSGVNSCDYIWVRKDL